MYCKYVLENKWPNRMCKWNVTEESTFMRGTLHLLQLTSEFSYVKFQGKRRNYASIRTILRNTRQSLMDSRKIKHLPFQEQAPQARTSHSSNTIFLKFVQELISQERGIIQNLFCISTAILRQCRVFRQNRGRAGRTEKELRAMETYKQQKNCFQYPWFCSATMLTSKIIRNYKKSFRILWLRE